MSTAAPQAPPPAPPPSPYEIKIVSHSNLFYWWPVWAVGMIIGALTFFSAHRMVVVPKDTKAYRGARVEAKEGDKTVSIPDRDVLITPKKGDLPPHNAPDGPLEDPHFRIATEKSYGVLFVIVLLLVIVITNVPMRGLWSVVAIVLIVTLSIILALAHTADGRSLWDHIFELMGRLHIYINAAGYWVMSIGLFAIWLVTFIFFDPQIYMVFTPKQLRVRQEIGGGEAAYDTTGMVIQKQRNDLFRHWVLGLGSGDLIVNTSGATSHHFDMPNVLFVGYKLRQIEDMLREVQMAPSGTSPR
jgi:hypothetical protein